MAQPKIFKVVNTKRVPDAYKTLPGERVRYRFVADTGVDPQTGKRKQLTRTYDKLKDAQADLAKILDEVNKGAYVQPSKITVEEYLEEWLHNATRGREQNTKRAYRDALRPARELYGQKMLRALTTDDVEEMVDWMLAEGRKCGGKPGTPLSPRMVQLTLSKLRAALKKAVQRKLVDYNVAEPVETPAQIKTKRVPWTPDEVRTFLAALEGHRLYAPVLLALMGIGPAELCGLRWKEEVDLDAGTVRAGKNTRTLVDGHTVEKPGKTEFRDRTLPLPPQVTAGLRKLRALQAADKLAAGEGYTDSGYVLVDELGRPFDIGQFRRRLYALMTKAKVRKVRAYDARHACLTYLATNGVPPAIVGAWAGHSDLTTALIWYTHPNTENLKQATAALTELFTPEGTDQAV